MRQTLGHSKGTFPRRRGKVAHSPNQEPGIPPGDLQGLCRHGPWSSPGEQRGRERSPAGFHTIPFGCSGPSSVKRRMFTQGESRVSEFGQAFTQVKAGVSDPDSSCNSRNPGCLRRLGATGSPSFLLQGRKTRTENLGLSRKWRTGAGSGADGEITRPLVAST